MPRYHFGHFINNTKTEKRKEYRKEGQLIYFISKPSAPMSAPLLQGRSKPTPGTNPGIKMTSYRSLYLAWSCSFPFKNAKQAMEIVPMLIPQIPPSTIPDQFIDSPSCYVTNSSWQPKMGESLSVNQLWQWDGMPHSGVGQPLSHCHPKAFPLGTFNYPFPQQFAFQHSLKGFGNNYKPGKV